MQIEKCKMKKRGVESLTFALCNFHFALAENKRAEW